MKKTTTYLKADYEFADGEEGLALENMNSEAREAFERAIALPAAARKFKLSVQVVAVEELEPEHITDRMQQLRLEFT